ncbi:hypothetical protein JXD20_03420 [Candidatus Peregrinibacteria bacterium]|nr:hypothetical protein [Candidatus Peregrinibacteria bacterium]
MKKAPETGTGPDSGAVSSETAPRSQRSSLDPLRIVTDALGRLSSESFSKTEVLEMLEQCLAWFSNMAIEAAAQGEEAANHFKIKHIPVLKALETVAKEKGVFQEYRAIMENALSALAGADRETPIQPLPAYPSETPTMQQSGVVETADNSAEDRKTAEFNFDQLPPDVKNELPTKQGQPVVPAKPFSISRLFAGFKTPKTGKGSQPLFSTGQFVPTVQAEADAQLPDDFHPLELLEDAEPSRPEPLIAPEAELSVEPASVEAPPNLEAQKKWTTHDVRLFVLVALGMFAVGGGTAAGLYYGKKEVDDVIAASASNNPVSKARSSMDNIPKKKYGLAENPGLDKYMAQICASGPPILCEALKEAREKTVVEISDYENSDFRIKTEFLNNLEEAIRNSETGSRRSKEVAFAYVKVHQRHLRKYGDNKKEAGELLEEVVPGTRNSDKPGQ